MDPDGQLRNLRDFLLVYNRMTEICFQRCTANFNYRNLTMDEEHCADSCAGKLIRSNHRLMGTYVKLMPAMMQRRMEELESKAAETAKAAEVAAPVEPLAGGLGTPETTTMVSSSTAEHVGTTEALAGSVSFTPSISEPTLSDLSPAPAPEVPLMSESAIQAGVTAVPSQAPNVPLISPLVTEHEQNAAVELPAVVPSTQGSSPVNSSLPAQGSLSSVVAAIPIEKLALKQRATELRFLKRTPLSLHREVDPQPPPTRVWTLVSDRLPLPSPSLHSSQSRHFTRSQPQLTGPTKPTCPVTECTTALHLWHPSTAASHPSPRELLVGDEGFHQCEE
ncbi:hypothetical protein MHYP_G00193230 [Metynnis hypsauchen]